MENLVCENLNEFLGLSVREKFNSLNPHDDYSVNKLFNSVYKNILINPYMTIIGDKAKRLSTPQKYDLIRQYVNKGCCGTLRLKKDGTVIYVSEKDVL